MRQLAKSAGVSNPYLSQVERGLRNPSAEILGQIARALRISAETLYVQAGLLDERPTEDAPSVSDAIAADPLLTDRQRDALLDIYTAFIAEAVSARTENDSTSTATAPRSKTTTATPASSSATPKSRARSTTPRRTHRSATT